MKKILLFDDNGAFCSDIEVSMMFAAPENTKIMIGQDLDHIFASINEIKPDEVLINTQILKNYPDWDIDIPIRCYARDNDGLLLADDCGIPCYGIIKTSTDLFEAIKSGKTITITDDEKKQDNSPKSPNNPQITPQNNATQKPEPNKGNAQGNNHWDNNSNNGGNNKGTQKQKKPKNKNQNNKQNQQNNSPNSPNMPFSPESMQGLTPEQMQMMMMQMFASMQQGNVPNMGNAVNATNLGNQGDIGDDEESFEEDQFEEDDDILNRNNVTNDILGEEDDDEVTFIPSKKKKNNQSGSVKEKFDEARRKKEEEEFAKTEAIRKIQEEDAKKAVESDLGNIKKPAKVVTVYSAKGGVGKTTISCELATFLALTSHGRGKFRVCIADFNIDFGDVLNTLSFDPEKGCMSYWASEIQSDLDMGKKPEDIQYTKERISVYLQKNETDGLYALLAPFTNEDSMNITDTQMEIMLDNLVNNCDFDFVICDTGNNTRDSSVISLEKADEILLVMTQDVNTANCNNGFLSTMEKYGLDLNKIRLVINKAQPAKTVAISTEELEEAFINPNTNAPYPCIAKIKYDNEVKHMNNLGKPLVYDSSSDFTKTIGEIASEVIGENFVLGKPEKKSFFSKLFGKKEKK